MDKYINISDIAGRISEMSPAYAIQSWLRDYSVLEFLMIWESKYNPKFDNNAYIELVEKARRNEVTMTAKLWIDSTKAIGITSKQGRYGSTYAHKAIACEFMMWLSPRYRFMIVESFLLVDDGGEGL